VTEVSAIPIERRRVLSMLVHARAKAGKSTLTSTVPLPAIVLDAEGSWNFIDEAGFRSGIPLRRRDWDPLQEELPPYDGTWDVLHVQVTSWQILQQCYTALTQYKHSFRSLVMDSITECQRRCKANIKGGGQMQTQQWGMLLDSMDGMIRGFRDLTKLENTLQCVVFVAETKNRDGRWVPYMQGQIAETLPYFVDICSFLEVERQENGDTYKNVRVLTVGPDPTKETGERVAGRLPDIIEEPNISAMLAAIYPNT
jgi:hypothetical protein